MWQYTLDGICYRSPTKSLSMKFAMDTLLDLVSFISGYEKESRTTISIDCFGVWVHLVDDTIHFFPVETIKYGTRPTNLFQLISGKNILFDMVGIQCY